MTIEIQTTSDSSRAQRDLAELRKSVDGIKKSTESVTKTFDTLAKTVAVAASAFVGFQTFTRLSDNIVNLENRLKAVTKDQIAFNKSLNNVKTIAVNTRTPLSSVANLYSKVALSSQRFNISQEKVAAFSSTVSKALKLQGATVQEAAGAIQQLGQGLASGFLSGDELRTVREAAPILAQQIAKGLNKNIGDLKKLGEQGKLTFDVVFKAILAGQKEIDESFNKLTVTYADAFTNLGNAFNLLFDSVSKKFSSGRGGIASFINDIALAISDFALDIDYYILRVKLSLFSLVIDFNNLFKNAFGNFENILKRLLN